MARSRISEDQVLDSEFISPGEHADPSEIQHYFINSVDVPATYSGSVGKLMVIRSDASGVDFVDYHAVSDSTDLYVEVIRDSNRISQINEWKDSNKTFMISSTVLVREGTKVSKVIKYIYDSETGQSIETTVSGVVYRTNGKVGSVNFDRDNS